MNKETCDIAAVFMEKVYPIYQEHLGCHDSLRAMYRDIMSKPGIRTRVKSDPKIKEAIKKLNEMDRNIKILSRNVEIFLALYAKKNPPVNKLHALAYDHLNIRKQYKPQWDSYIESQIYLSNKLLCYLKLNG